jgi:tetratricopeptide (TPR) repeat protein
MSSQHTKIRLEKKLKENPQSLVFARLADIYLTEDRIDDAIQICQAGLKGNPSYVTGHFVLAKAYMLQNDMEKAESALKKVLTHDRNFISAHKYLGDLMIKLGWENTAITHYKDILNIDPLESNILSILEKLSDEIPEAIDLPSGTSGDSPAPVPESRVPSGTPPGEEEWMNQIREVFPDDQSSQDSAEATSKPPESEPSGTAAPENSIPPSAPPPEKATDSGTAKVQADEETAGSAADESESVEPTEPVSDVDLFEPTGGHMGTETGDSEPLVSTDTTVKTEERDDSIPVTPSTLESSETDQSENNAGFIEFDVDAIQFDDSAQESGTTMEPKPQESDEPAQRPVSDAPDTLKSDVPAQSETRDAEEDQPVSAVEELAADSVTDQTVDSAVSATTDLGVTECSSSVSEPEAATDTEPLPAETDDDETLSVLDAWTESSDEAVQPPSEAPADRSEESPESGQNGTDSDVQEIVSEEESLLEMSPETDNEKEIDLHETFDIPSKGEEESAEQALDLDIEISDDEEAAPVSADSGKRSDEALPSDEEKEAKTTTLEPPAENGTFEAKNRKEPIPEAPSAEAENPDATNNQKPTPKKAPAEPASETEPEPTDGSISSPEASITSKILTPTLGEIYIAQGQFDKALDVYQKLLEMHPNEKKYQEKIAFIQEKMKDMNL